MNDVATKKPRICGYVSDSLNDAVNSYMNERSCSQSAAVEEAALALFGLSQEEMSNLINLAEEKHRSVGAQALELLSNAIRDHVSKR